MRRIIALTIITLLLTSTVANAEPLRKETFVVGVENNREIFADVLGYHKDLPDGKQVFIECTPDGIPTGNGYIQGKVGTIEREEAEMIALPEREVLDFNNPIEIKPLAMTLFMPNVPVDRTLKYFKTSEDGTMTEIKDSQEIRDLHATGQQHQVLETTGNTLTWGMYGCGSGIYIPSKDPNAWLVVAEVKNPNNFAVEAMVGTYMLKEPSGWAGYDMGASLALIPDSATYNNIHKFKANEKKLILIPAPKERIGAEASFATQITEILTDKHPTAQLGKLGGFTPVLDCYDWNTNKKAVAKIPMQVKAQFRVNSIKVRDGYRTISIAGSGGAYYDGEAKKWVVKASDDRMDSSIQYLFDQWGFKVPTIYNYWDKYNKYQTINGITFADITMTPWAYSQQSPSYRASEFIGCRITDDYRIDYNIAKASSGHYIPAGTFEEHGFTQVGCFDPRWMDAIPVIKTNPMFIEKYNFIKTNGNEGYLEKTFVPGVNFYRSLISRPTVNWEKQVQKITATQVISKYGKGQEHCVYEWTKKDGWITKEDTTTLPISGLISWGVEAEYNNVVIAKNPNDVPVSIVDNAAISSNNLLDLFYSKENLVKIKDGTVSFANPFARTKDNGLLPDFPQNELIITTEQLNLGANATKTIQEFSSSVVIPTNITSRDTKAALASILQACRTKAGTKEAAWVNGALYLGQPQLSNYGNILYGSQKTIFYQYTTNDKYRDTMTKNTKIGFDYPPAITGTSYSRSLFLELDNKLLESPEGYRILSSGACGNFPYRRYNPKNKTFTLPDYY